MKWKLKLSLWCLVTLLAGCNTNPRLESQQQLAGEIYAQLAIGYMTSGHFELAQQRLNKALKMSPHGALTLQAQEQWLRLQPSASQKLLQIR